MKCPRCQHENSADAVFCDECGARLDAACPACGEANRAGAKFCRKCGRPIGTAAHAQARFATPQTYTPKHLAERILTSKAALEGERKQVTVLFADLKGSMELLADRDPEEARKLLDPVLERMMEAVHRYEGTVNQVMGDGIMALFGAPLAHEDHAVRACYAALRMQESVKRYADEVHRTAGVPLHIRVGLNSGEVVVRAIGSDLHMDYTAVGQTTHLAARMEQLAVPGSILISPDTLRLAEGWVQVKSLGTVNIKGLGESVEVFELTGALGARTRLQASGAHGLTCFVGREAELDTLRRAGELARDGHGQVVAVVGEPGVGKSRLFWEFRRSHHTQGWLVLESGAVSYGKATPYLPVIGLLRAYFQTEGPDDPRRITEKVTGKLLTLDRSLEPLLIALLALLEVPVDDRQWRYHDPHERRRRTLDAVKRLLLHESRVQPLCLVFEDLHWIDSETQALLDGLIESLPGARLLLLVNYRPEYTHDWASKTYYRQLRVDPLPAANAQGLLDALLGEDTTVQPLKPLLVARTEGTPFFLEESVRALVEGKALLGERGAYRLARSLDAVQVPATVQAILAARIDRLAPEEKSLLQTAAVIGKDVPFGLLQAIADRPEHELRQGLERLQAAEFLYETRLFPDLEYTFKHALTHEVTYGSLLQGRRRALHARIIEATERFYPDRLAEHVEQLAYHAVRGDVWNKSVMYLREAGRKAASRAAHREAVARFEQALAALAHLPESRETMQQAVDLRFELRSSLVPLLELGRAFECLKEAKALAENLDDQRRLGWVSVYMTACLWAMGDSRGAVESGERALPIAESLGDSAFQILTNFYLGRACYAIGDYGRSMILLKRTVESLADDQVRNRLGVPFLPSVLSRVWLAWCLAERGDFAEAVAIGRDAVAIAESLEQPYDLILAHFGLGGVYLRQGVLEAAIRLLERGLAICQQHHLPLLLAPTVSRLGYAYALSGQFSRALELMEENAPSLTSATIGGQLYDAWLGEAYLLAGRLDDAARLAERALQRSREHQERGVEAWALRLIGEILSRGDPPEEERAQHAYLAALALSEERGMAPLVAHCHLGLGALYCRLGTRERARADLLVALKQLRSLGMTLWLNRAEAEWAKTDDLTDAS